MSLLGLNICRSLEKSNGDHRRLDAPVFLGQAVEEKEDEGSIWIAKKENVTVSKSMSYSWLILSKISDSA